MRNRMYYWFIVLGLTLSLMSCRNDLETTTEINQIDALLEKVSEAKDDFEGLPHEDINNRLKAIKSTIAFVEEASGGVINRDNGLLLDGYRSTKSIVKRFGSRSSQMRVEFDRTKSQLTNFKKALEENATHDKKNTAIDEAYISANLKKETEAAIALIDGVNELVERSSRFLVKNQEKLEELNPYLDSLK